MTFTESQLSLLGEFRQLAELRERATEGPFRYDQEGDYIFAGDTGSEDDVLTVFAEISGHGAGLPIVENGEYVAAVLNAIPALLKRVVELGEERDKAIQDSQEMIPAWMHERVVNGNKELQARGEAAEEQKARLEHSLTSFCAKHALADGDRLVGCPCCQIDESREHSARLEAALREIVAKCSATLSGHRDWEQQMWERMNFARKTAETALAATALSPAGETPGK